MLLGFRVDREPGVALRFVLFDPLADAAKLCIAISMFSTGNVLPDLSIPYSGVTKPSGDGVVSNRRPHIGESPRQIAGRQIGKKDIFFVWVACRPDFKASDQVFFFRGLGVDLFFRPAPGRRTRPAAGSSAN